VKDKSDIDLVVYMRDDGIDGTIEEQREKAIAFLKIHIASHSQCSFDGKTQAAVKVKLQVDSTHTVDVDILPTFLCHGIYIFRIMCPSIATYLPADFSFSELALSKPSQRAVLVQSNEMNYTKYV
jgi:hypothetical protein